MCRPGEPPAESSAYSVLLPVSRTGCCLLANGFEGQATVAAAIIVRALRGGVHMNWKSLVCGAVLSFALAAPAQAATIQGEVGFQGIGLMTFTLAPGASYIDFLPAGTTTGIMAVGTPLGGFDAFLDPLDPGHDQGSGGQLRLRDLRLHLPECQTSTSITSWRFRQCPVGTFSSMRFRSRNAFLRPLNSALDRSS